jgi:hypothetical protein
MQRVTAAMQQCYAAMLCSNAMQQCCAYAAVTPAAVGKDQYPQLYTWQLAELQLFVHWLQSG